MTRCPLCRGRLSTANTCSRCGADLALADAARHAAARQLQHALICLASGERDRAAAHANQALRLHRTPLAETIADWLRAPALARALHVKAIVGNYKNQSLRCEERSTSGERSRGESTALIPTGENNDL